MRAAGSDDFDADGTPDFMDNCPGIENDQADDDGDGVGDACDPHRGEAGDCIAFFGVPREDAWTVAAGMSSRRSRRV